MATADQSAYLLDQANVLVDRFMPCAADFDRARNSIRVPAMPCGGCRVLSPFRARASGWIRGLSGCQRADFRTIGPRQCSLRIAFIAATSGSTLASIPEDTARAIFSHPNTMVAGVFAPSGKAEVDAGQVTVNGRWQWGSGTQNADWVWAGAWSTLAVKNPANTWC